MLEKTYIRRPRTVKAIQYDGTYESAVAFEREYRNLEINSGYLYFTGNSSKDEIYTSDWLIIEDGTLVVEIIDRDVFEEMYEKGRF
jgi:hypothetical protein